MIPSLVKINTFDGLNFVFTVTDLCPLNLIHLLLYIKAKYEIIEFSVGRVSVPAPPFPFKTAVFPAIVPFKRTSCIWLTR